MKESKTRAAVEAAQKNLMFSALQLDPKRITVEDLRELLEAAAKFRSACRRAYAHRVPR